MKNKKVFLLADSTFQCNLAFLTYIVHHLNELNFELQGKKTDYYTYVGSCEIIQSTTRFMYKTVG